MLRTLTTSFLVAVCLVGSTAENLSAQGSCPGTPLVEILGTGTPGAPGIPELQVQGAPVVGMPFSLGVSGALPLAKGFLFVGTSAVPTLLPKFGATFFPASPIITVPFVAGADGGAQLASFSALGAEFCGLDVWSCRRRSGMRLPWVAPQSRLACTSRSVRGSPPPRTSRWASFPSRWRLRT